MIDWTRIKHFKPSEFSEDPNTYATPELIYALERFRMILDRPIYPSPASGALARTYKTKSLHHVDLERNILSRAIDCFPEADPREVFWEALACQLWGGVGVYLDTKLHNKPYVMFHLDLRPLGYGHDKQTALFWIRLNGKYYYPQSPYMAGGMQFLFETLQQAAELMAREGHI